MINKEYLRSLADENGIVLDDLALDRFDKYAALLVEWNEKMNLTGITEPDEIVVKHFLDCLLITRHYDFKDGMSVVDLGTGAGFPAIPLLIFNPSLKMTLADSLKKRLDFLQIVLDELELEASIVHGRAEDIGHEEVYREAFDAAVARAVAPMNVLAEYCLPLVKIGGAFVALKGSNDDVSDAENAIKTLGGELESYVSYKLIEENDRSIALVKKISQTSTQYPRKPKKIASKPL